MSFQDRDRPLKRICLGKITKAHGVKGLVKIRIYGDDPHLLESAPLYTDETGHTTLKLTLKNSDGKGHYLAAVDGVIERNGAAALNGTLLYAPREALPDIESDDQFYIEDLKGLRVIESGQDIGRVLNVDNFGAGDLIEIQPKIGRSFYVPFNNDFVVGVDLESGAITVKNSDSLKVV